MIALQNPVGACVTCRPTRARSRHGPERPLDPGSSTVKNSTVSETSNRSRKKRDEIIRAATKVFLAAGYNGASMDAITRESGVSKATIYSHFASKEALFGAIIREQCGNLMRPILQASARADTPEGTLRTISESFMTLMMSEIALALYRVAMAEAPRFPELARTFYKNGPEYAIHGLAGYLKEQAKLGRLDIPDAIVAAEQFFSLLTGYLHVRTVLGVTPSPDLPDMTEHIDCTIDTFLRAYTPRPVPMA